MSSESAARKPAEAANGGLADVELGEVDVDVVVPNAHDLISTVPVPITLSFDGISLNVAAGSPDEPLAEQARKDILQNLSGTVRPGELMCILGASGSGKTSTIDVLAGQHEAQLDGSSFLDGGDVDGDVEALLGPRLTGKILMNGVPRTKAMKRRIAYVHQHDTFFENLTVRETLTFSALLRLPGEIPREQKLAVVDHVIELLNLGKCQNTIVGNHMVRGISGGERRRLNIGDQILTNPSILLADEPTSGLDAATAKSVLAVLKDLARAGRAVAITIHQPSSRLFSMFDKLLLLADGRTIYYGPADQAVAYFASIGYPCPQHYNPADFLLELVTGETLSGDGPKVADLADTFQERHGGLERAISSQDHSKGYLSPDDLDPPNRKVLDANGADSANVPLQDEESARRNSDRSFADDLEDEFSAGKRWPTTFWQQLSTLTVRSFKQSRGSMIKNLYLVQFVAMALTVGFVWFNTGRSEEEMQDRIGLLFFVPIFWGFTGMFRALMTFPNERAVLKKERGAGAYRLSAYFIAKSSSDIPLEMLYPTLYVLIYYFMGGLDAEFVRFLGHLFIILLVTLAAQSFGLMVSCAIMDVEKALTFAGTILLAMMLISGFYADSSNIPDWIGWLKYLSFSRYAYDAVVQIDTIGRTYSCIKTGRSRFPSCRAGATEITDDEVLDEYNSNEFTIGEDIAFLLFTLFFCRFLAYTFLRYKRL